MNADIVIQNMLFAVVNASVIITATNPTIRRAKVHGDKGFYKNPTA